MVSLDRAAFDAICNRFHAVADKLEFQEVLCIPIDVTDGSNISVRAEKASWYSGPVLRDYLDTVEFDEARATESLRLLVKSVDASSTKTHEFVGALMSGQLQVGDELAALPSGQTTRVKSMTGREGPRETAQAGDTVTLTTIEEIEVSPGSLLSPLRDRPQVADQFAAHVIWLSNERLLPGRPYGIRLNGTELSATITDLKYQIDVENLSKLAAKTLAAGEIGMCNLSLAQPAAFDPYAVNSATGNFVLFDRDSGERVAVGLIDFALRRATNVHYQNITVTKAQRVASKRHRPAVLWFTGLPSAGKSTIANLVEAALQARGAHTILLDGDNIRHGLNRDLGFTQADRVENIRRIGEVAKLMTDAGLIVLCAFISPFRAERRMVRELLGEGEFFEIFVDTSLDECIARDPKGLYGRALAGEIKNFTGVDQAYEAPEHPELHLKSERRDAQLLAQDVVAELERQKIVSQ